jgi:flagellar hook-associated protein 1 FlgK
MSLSATLSTALTGLSTAQRSLAVTAHNVANANTEGYTRKVAVQETLLVEERGVGSRPLEAQRVVDEYLGGELRSHNSQLGRSTAVARYYERMQESLFGAPGDGNRGVSNRLTRLATAAEALASAPEKASLAVAFIGAAQDVVQQIGNDARQVQALRGDADREIEQTIGAVNDDLRALHQLNVEIVRSRSPAELLDRRDALLASLSQKLPVSVARQEDGRVALFTRGGKPLLEQEPSQLFYRSAAQVTAGTVFGPIEVYRASDVDANSGAPLPDAKATILVSSGQRAALTPELKADAINDVAQTITSPLNGGKLQGLLEARDRVLPEIDDQLGELGRMVRFTLNAAHNDAVSTPLPSRLQGTRTEFSGFEPSANSGQAFLAVVNRASGQAVTTIAIDAAAATPDAIVAQIHAGLGAHGSATLNAAGGLEISLNDPALGIALDEGTSSIAVSDAAGHAWRYGLSHYFGLNDLIVGRGSSPTDLAVRPDILADSGKLSAVTLTIEGGPPLTARAGGTGDNRAAQGLAAALNRSVTAVARGAIAARDTSLVAYAADIVALNAVATNQAKNDQATDEALVEDLAFRQGNVSGVNVDEELSKLVLYQQAYSVSARIVSITNQLFDDLMSIGR